MGSLSDHDPNKSEVSQQIARVGFAIRDGLAAALDPVVGSFPRVSHLVEALGLDKTNAWRIVRTLEARTGESAIHETSAPSGLGMVLKAARKAGSPAEACEPLEAAIASFAELIAEFPDGRRGVAAAVVIGLDGAADAMHRNARRKVVQGLTEMLGLRGAIRYFATIMTPGTVAGLGDVIGVGGYRELRRVRCGPRPVVFSTQTYTKVAREGDPRALTLDGLDDPDPRLRLLTQFSDLSADKLTLQQRGREQRLILDSDTPAVNEPVDLFFAQRVTNAIDLSSTGHGQAEIIHHQPKIPTEHAIYDTIVHRDVFPDDDPPQSTVEWFGFNPVVQASFPDDDSYRVDWNPETRPMGSGLDGVKHRDLPYLPRLLGHVFDQVGLDPADFRLYRTAFPLSVPGVSLAMWFETRRAVEQTGDDGA